MKSFLSYCCCLLFALSVSGCNYSSSQGDSAKLWGVLGAGIFDGIKSSSVQFYSVAHQLPDPGAQDYAPSTTPVELSAEERSDLRHLFLNDSHYLFGVHKKCVFIPETAFSFKTTQGQVFAFVSLQCKQIQFVMGEQKEMLDFDPAFDEFTLFINGLSS